LLLVNNQRLHEPADHIVENVVEAIEDKDAYQHSSFILNEHDKVELLGENRQSPDPAKTFRPFSKESEDLCGQVQRIKETIDERCEAAKLERIPTIVIWPERELSSASSVDPLAELSRSRGGPISILCPDADPEKARRLEAALRSADGAQTEITVRSPKTPELVVHIEDILHAGEPSTPEPEKDQ
jgi:hypothetical protein